MNSAAKKKPPRDLDGAADETTGLSNGYPNDSQIASTVRDTKRDGPWCWQSKPALKTIADIFDNDIVSARSVYVALSEIASDEGSAIFTRPIRQIADRAGVAYRTAATILNRFELLKLIDVDRHVVEGTKERAPSTFTMLGNKCLTLGIQNDFQLPRSTEEREETKKVSHAHTREPLSPEQQRQFHELHEAVKGLTDEDAIKELQQRLPDRNVKRHRAEFLTFCRKRDYAATIDGLLRRLVKAKPELRSRSRINTKLPDEFKLWASKEYPAKRDEVMKWQYWTDVPYPDLRKDWEQRINAST